MTKYPEQSFDVEALKNCVELLSTILRREDMAQATAALNLALEIAQGEAWACRAEGIENAPKEVTRIVAVGEEYGSVSPVWSVVDWGEKWCSHGCFVPTHYLTFNGKPTLPKIEE